MRGLARASIAFAKVILLVNGRAKSGNDEERTEWLETITKGKSRSSK
jgi:hypothetical protein